MKKFKVTIVSGNPFSDEGAHSKEIEVESMNEEHIRGAFSKFLGSPDAREKGIADDSEIVSISEKGY